MPTYDYVCQDCGHSFEAFQSMKDDPLSECPTCQGKVKRWVGGGTGIIFKGSGFYINDSKKSAEAPKAPKADPKPVAPGSRFDLIAKKGKAMHGLEGDEKVAQMMRLRAHMKKIKHKVVVLSGKGGVGKSTVSVNLAMGLVQKGFKVGLLDTDIHGPNVAHMLGLDHKVMVVRENEIEPLEARPNLFVVSLALAGRPVDTAYIWRGPIKIALINQLMADTLWPDLDFLIVDSPPGTGDEPLTVCQLLNSSPSRGTVIVTTPQSVSVLDARRTIDFSRQLKMPILGLVENMAGYLNPADGTVLPLFGEGGGLKAATELQIPFLGSIAMDPRAVVLSEKGLALLEAETGLKESFSRVIDGIVSSLEKGTPASGS